MTGQLEPIERASRDELEATQLWRLKATLAHAFERVRHYREKFTVAGVHPDDLKALADLATARGRPAEAAAYTARLVPAK